MCKKIIIFCIFISCYFTLSAQLTYGVTGLLHAPSAEMQKDKTVMIGGNFLNREITPPTWWYHTYNYYLNVTIFPFLEVSYVCTLFKFRFPQWGMDEYKFRNQDRYFGARLRILEEKKYIPAIVLGTSDPFSRETKVINSETGNGYFCRFFLAATKHFDIGSEQVGVHLSYLYNRRKDYSLNGIAGGVSYSPSKVPDLKFIAEYDTKDIAVGATYLLFNHFHFLVELQRFKYFTGGITYKVVLK